MNSIPKLKGKRGERVSSIPGTVPSTYVVPVGCGFAARCPYAKEQCFKELPDRVLVEDEHEVSCFLFNGGEVKKMLQMPNDVILQVKGLKNTSQ